MADTGPHVILPHPTLGQRLQLPPCSGPRVCAPPWPACGTRASAGPCAAASSAPRCRKAHYPPTPGTRGMAPPACPLLPGCLPLLSLLSSRRTCKFSREDGLPCDGLFMVCVWCPERCLAWERGQQMSVW